MKFYNGLPVYKMKIDESDLTGVEYISLVDFPAIEKNFVAMSDVKLYASLNDKQILTGPVMIPDLCIYRNDPKLGEYYVVFDANEISKISKKFNKEQRTLGINYKHQSNSQVNSAVIIEQWFITDKQNDKSNSFGFDLPVGTWMVSVYIEDKDFWTNEIKTGNVRGFSIEGFLNLEMCKHTNTIEDMYNKLSDILNKNKMNKIDMNKIKMNAEIKTKDGIILYTPADSFNVDAEVYIVDDKGDSILAANNDYTLDNGDIITVVNGKITNIVKKEIEIEQSENTSQFEINDEMIAEINSKLGISDLTSRIEKLEKTIGELTKTNEMLSKHNKELFEKFSKLPGTTEAATSKNDEVISTKMNFNDKLNAVIALRKK